MTVADTVQWYIMSGGCVASNVMTQCRDCVVTWHKWATRQEFTYPLRHDAQVSYNQLLSSTYLCCKILFFWTVWYEWILRFFWVAVFVIV